MTLLCCFTPQHNGAVTHADSKTNRTHLMANETAAATQIKLNTGTTLLAVFTVDDWFLPRKSRHDLSRFTAEVRSACHVNEQSRLHDS